MMKVLALFFSLLISISAFAESASCFSADEKVEIFLVVRDNKVLFFDLEKDLFIEEVKATLLEGRYLDNQAVNRELGFPFHANAWVSVNLHQDLRTIRFSIFGQEDSNLYHEVYGANLHCYRDIYKEL